MRRRVVAALPGAACISAGQSNGEKWLKRLLDERKLLCIQELELSGLSSRFIHIYFRRGRFLSRITRFKLLFCFIDYNVLPITSMWYMTSP